MRSSRYIYTVYQNKDGTKEMELYDLQQDPYELQNVVDDPTYVTIREDLSARLAVLCNPPPPGTSLP